MKLSALDASFARLKAGVDRLVQGVPAAEFADGVRALKAALRDLEPWTHPGGGGRFDVDLEPYASAGGAPRFMRERAPLLLAAVTTLRRAQGAQMALHKRLGPPARDDLAVPLGAPLRYSGEDVAKVQRVFRYLYARRAYRKLYAGQVVVRSLEAGHLPEHVRNIAQLSKYNLGVLRHALTPLSEPERRLHAILRDLPFHLKHATSAAAWAGIVSSGLIFSKDALVDWGITVRTNSPISEKVYKNDIDFAFFRVEVGTQDWVSRFGEENDQLRAVFDWRQVLEDGWVTLHDMLAPLGTSGEPVVLRTRHGGEVVRTSQPDMPLEGLGRKKWIHWTWRHAYPGSDRTRQVHILDEVFLGPDVLEGIVLSALRDLRELPALQQEAFERLPDAGYAYWLIKSLFRIEAKVPSAFRFEPDDVVKTYPEDAPALRAATGSTA